MMGLMRTHTLLHRSLAAASPCFESSLYSAFALYATAPVAGLHSCLHSSVRQLQHIPSLTEFAPAQGTAGQAGRLCYRSLHFTPVRETKAAKPNVGKGISDAGWTQQEVLNIPNALSMARLVSGPGIAWLILNEQWGLALGSLVISGASDWADGFVAKRYGQSSVLGSYLDPLADKVLIGCVVGALGFQGSLPVWLVVLIVGRDVALLGGAFVHRFHKVGWRWPGTAEFFRLSSPASDSKTQASKRGHTGSAPSTANLIHSTSQHASTGSTSSSNSSNGTGRGQAASREADTSVNASIAAISDIGSSASQHEPQQAQDTSSVQEGTGTRDQPTQPAAFVQPLYISKVNTCFQLFLVGGCLTSSWYGWPPQEALFSFGVVTGGTTLASSAAYARAYLQGKIK